MRRLGLLALLVVSTQALSVVTRAPLRRTRACVSRSGSAPVSDLSVVEPSYNLALGTIAQGRVVDVKRIALGKALGKR